MGADTDIAYPFCLLTSQEEYDALNWKLGAGDILAIITEFQ